MDGVYMDLPKKFKDRMESLLGEEYRDFADSYRKPHFGGLRVNTLKLSPGEFEHLCPFSIRKIPWIYNGYYYDINEQPARHPYYHAGLYYIQEPSAMFPAEVLKAEPEDRVLDLCAAPGGKTVALAASMKNRGFLLSNDINPKRIKALVKNIELCGITNTVVTNESPERLSEVYRGFFNKVLLDVRQQVRELVQHHAEEEQQRREHRVAPHLPRRPPGEEHREVAGPERVDHQCEDQQPRGVDADRDPLHAPEVQASALLTPTPASACADRPV